MFNELHFFVLDRGCDPAAASTLRCVSRHALMLACLVVHLGRQVNCALLSEDLATVLMTCEIQIAHQNLLVTRSGLPGKLCA